jgi:hypothetical protein
VLDGSLLASSFLVYFPMNIRGEMFIAPGSGFLEGLTRNPIP